MEDERLLVEQQLVAAPVHAVRAQVPWCKREPGVPGDPHAVEALDEPGEVRLVPEPGDGAVRLDGAPGHAAVAPPPQRRPPLRVAAERDDARVVDAEAEHVLLVLLPGALGPRRRRDMVVWDDQGRGALELLQDQRGRIGEEGDVSVHPGHHVAGRRPGGHVLQGHRLERPGVLPGGAPGARRGRLRVLLLELLDGNVPDRRRAERAQRLARLLIEGDDVEADVGRHGGQRPLERQREPQVGEPGARDDVDGIGPDDQRILADAAPVVRRGSPGPDAPSRRGGTPGDPRAVVSRAAHRIRSSAPADTRGSGLSGGA